MSHARGPIAVLAFGWALVSGAQAWVPCPAQEVLEHAEANGKAYAALPVYEMRVELASYRSSTDVAPFDRAESLLQKAGDRSRVDHMGIITVQDGRLRVTVDTTEHVILVAKADDIMDVIGADHAHLIIEQAAAVTKKAIAAGVTYKVMFRPGAYYDRVEITYDKDGILARADLFWRIAIQEDPDDPRSPAYTPRVTMLFGRPRAIAEAAITKRLDLSAYIVMKNGRPIAAPGWTGYEVIDTRVP